MNNLQIAAKGLPPRWVAVNARKLSEEEAPGAHHIYINVHRDGQDARGTVQIRWGWAGMQPEEAPAPVPTDKQPPEPAANIPLWPGQLAWVEVDGEPSERVVGMDAFGGWLVEFQWQP